LVRSNLGYPLANLDIPKCGTAGKEAYRAALRWQFWTTTALALLLLVASGWLLAHGGLAAWLRAVSGEGISVSTIVVAAAGLVTVLNLAAVPFSYGKLLRSTVLERLSERDFVLMRTTDKVILVEITATAEAKFKTAKAEDTQSHSTPRDLLQESFETALALADPAP
jgi:hypothetical protein